MKVVGDAVFVPLTKRALHHPQRFALIDMDDYERVTRSKWYAPQGKSYVFATGMKYLAAHHRSLHAYILRVQPGQLVDHINGDTFDNRSQNLRVATATGNSQNRKRATFPGKTSRFKGVCFDRTVDKWLSRIKAAGEVTDLGHFATEETAARAYDDAALRLHGEFARTNEMMRLFEMVDPFVPDCSRAAVFDKKVNLQPTNDHDMRPMTYDQRLTARLRRELKSAA